MAKKYIVRPGEKVTIEIESSGTAPKQNKNTSNVRGGMIIPRSNSEYLPRRIQPSGINFYDLGFLNGADNYHSFVPTYTYPDFSWNGDATNAQLAALVLAFENSCFAVPSTDWKTSFKKVVKTEDAAYAVSVSYVRNGVTVTGDLKTVSAFTDKGLTLSASEVATLKINPGDSLFQYYNFDFAALETNFRVTTTRNINATPVAFTPSPAMDIYLTANFINRFGEVVYENGQHTYSGANGANHSDFIYNKEFIPSVYSTMPRALFAELLAIFNSTTLTEYQENYRYWQVLKQMPDVIAKKWIQDFAESPPLYPSTFTLSSLVVSAFPNSAIYGTGPFPTQPDSTHFNISNRASFAYQYINNRLAFVINKGTEWFYFWKV